MIGIERSRKPLGLICIGFVTGLGCSVEIAEPTLTNQQPLTEVQPNAPNPCWYMCCPTNQFSNLHVTGYQWNGSTATITVANDGPCSSPSNTVKWTSHLDPPSCETLVAFPTLPLIPAGATGQLSRSMPSKCWTGGTLAGYEVALDYHDTVRETNESDNLGGEGFSMCW